MKNDFSLNSLVNEVEQEIINESECGDSKVSTKTIERRFKDYLQKKNIKIKDLKGNEEKFGIDDTEAIFIKALIKEAIDKKSFAYKYIKDINEDVSLDDIADFMKKINSRMESELEDDERIEYMEYLDQSLQYGVSLELHNIYILIDCLVNNMNTTIYTYQLNSLRSIRDKLEIEYIQSTIENIKYITDLAEFKEALNNAFDGEDVNIYDVGDKAIEEEYLQRDRELSKYLDDNPLIKKHIEEKIGRKIEALYK